MERRFQPRALVEIDAQYRLSEGGVWQPALMRDLSGGGTAALIDDGLALGTALAGFRFLVPDEIGDSGWPVVVLAQVVRCDESPEAALPFLAHLQFLYPPERETEAVRRFVHRALHGDAADRVPIEVPPFEIVARSSAENRLARRLDTVRREEAALARDLGNLGTQTERARGVLDKRIAALQDVLYTAVSTEERLRAEIRRLEEGQRGAGDSGSDRGEGEELARLRRERADLAREVDGSQVDTTELRRRLAAGARDREAAVAEAHRLETELATVTAEVEALRAEKREMRAGAPGGPAPLPLPAPVARDSGWGAEVASLAAGLILGALGVLAWQYFAPPPPVEMAALPAAAAEIGDTETLAAAAIPAPLATPPEPVPATPPATAGPVEPRPRAAEQPPPDPPEREADLPAAASPGAARGGRSAPAGPPAEPPPAEPSTAEPEPTTRPDTGTLTATIEAWAAAWSEGRPDDHLALYSPDFRPPEDADRAAWEAERRRKVLAPDWQQLRIGRMRQRMIDRWRVAVDVNVICESDSERTQTTNSFELTWTGGSWKILRELREVGCRPAAPGPDAPPAQPSAQSRGRANSSRSPVDRPGSNE